MNLSAVEMGFLAASCAAIGAVAFAAFFRPSLSLPLLLSSLPVLNLARKSFPETAPPFPSLETAAVALLWFGLTSRWMLESTKDSRRVGGLGSLGLSLLGIFLFLALLSTLASEDRGRSARILLAGGIAPCACYWLTLRHVRTGRERALVVLGVIVMGVVAGIYTALNLQNRSNLAGNLIGSMALGWLYNEAPVVNVFVVPSVAVAATIPILPLAFWYGRYGRRHRLPVLAAAISSCALISLFSLSRGSWLATGAVLLGSLLILKQGRRVRVAAAAAAGLALLLAATAEYVMPVMGARLHGGILSLDGNMEGRAANYALALQSGLLHPFWGAGLGSYPVVYQDFPQSDAPALWFAHSLLLTLIPEVGALGGAVFALFFAGHVAETFRKRSLPPEEGDLRRAIGVGILGFLLVASTSGCHLVSYLLPETEWTYFSAPAMIVALTLLGLVPRRPEGLRPGPARDSTPP